MAFFIISKTTDSNGKRTLLAEVASRAPARDQARELGGTVKSEAGYNELREQGLIVEPADNDTAPVVETPAEVVAPVVDETPATDETPAEPVNPILEAAKQVAAAPKTRKTIGGKAKAEPKRKATPTDVLEAASAYLCELVEAGESKVYIVRKLTVWNNNVLQRCDVYALIHAHLTDLQIAKATVAWQFQFARSGKWAEKIAAKDTKNS